MFHSLLNYNMNSVFTHVVSLQSTKERHSSDRAPQLCSKVAVGTPSDSQSPCKSGFSVIFSSHYSLIAQFPRHQRSSGVVGMGVSAVGNRRSLQCGSVDGLNIIACAPKCRSSELDTSALALGSWTRRCLLLLGSTSVCDGSKRYATR